ANGTVDNGNEIIYTRGSGNPTVRLSWIDGLVPNSEYQVSVEVSIGSDWSGYGAAHTILIGEVPAPVLRNGYCGATIAPDGFILSTSVCEADSYTFELEPVGGGPVSIINSGSYIAQLSNASPALSFGNYNVRVRAKQGGVTGAYGIPCEISIGGQGF